MDMDDNKLKKAVVFGGAGFIGHHLLIGLAQSGEYQELVSADIRLPAHPVKGVNYKFVDVREEIPDDLCSGVSEIYNLAAVHTTPGHADWEYFWTNVLGATNVCEYATRCTVPFVVFTSSISVYGSTEQQKDEESPVEPDSAYGRSKYAAEKIHRLWQLGHPAERSLVIVRPAVIYGFGEEGNFTRLSRLLKRRMFVYPGRRDTIKACGYVEDLVASILWARERCARVFTYNFCHPERYTSEQICDAFARVGRYSNRIPLIPGSFMLFGAALFEILSAIGLRTSINRARILKLTRSTNVLPAKLQALGFAFRHDLESGLRRWKVASTTHDFD